MWARFEAGAYAKLSAADTQAVEDAYDASGGDICWLSSWEADLALGGSGTNRYVFGFATSVDNNGTHFLLARNTAETLIGFYRSDGGTTVATGSTTVTEEFFQGGEDFLQWLDTATGTTGKIEAKCQNRAGLDTIDASYDRTQLGVFDIVTVAGSARGATPTVFSILGWQYFTIIVTADTTAIADTIAADVAAADGQFAKYNATLDALIAGGFESSIIFAQAFHEGSTADYGDDATFVGTVTYTLAEGVP